jgi:hypothetical protein
MGKNRVSYGGRAFHQDASNAMKGDIVRGIIELVTNSDDAYGDSNGKIRIEIERRRGGKPSMVIVRDRAIGMRADEMKRKIGGLGEQTSGFEQGRAVRGNLGRGAKDIAAFGPVTFETICENRFSQLLLEEDGSYDDPTEGKASDSDRARLGVPRGNGTAVTVDVSAGIKCPQHAKLLEKLSRHYQLRDINADPRREITLVDLNTGRSDAVRYGPPALPEEVSTELVIDGYPDATASLTLYRNQERYEHATSDSSRPEGLLLKGRRAIYENTLFSFEGNPYAHWFSGVVRCPYIDHLALEFDQEHLARRDHRPGNPMRIITRSRDGLEHDHPFYKALSSAVESVLGEFVRREEEKAQAGTARESAKLRRTLDMLGRDLGRLIDADLREIDEDGLTRSGRGGADEGLRVIPQNPVLYMGENKTISVVAAKGLNETEITVELDPQGVVELLDGPTIPLVDHPRNDDSVIARVRLRPLIEEQETFLTVHLGDLELTVLIEVRPEREDPEPSIPETFEFERERYQMTVGKRRSLKLHAPVDVVDEHGLNATVTSSSPDVVVMGGRADLEFDEDLLCYVGAISVDPRVLGSKATLTATLGPLQATCDVVVVQQEATGPSIEIVIVDEAAGKYRARVDRTGEKTIIKILGGHPAIRRYLGPGPDFPHQDALHARALVAEVVAGEAARMIMEKKFSVPGELDAPAFYSEHVGLLTKYLTRCHKMMVSDAELLSN